LLVQARVALVGREFRLARGDVDHRLGEIGADIDHGARIEALEQHPERPLGPEQSRRAARIALRALLFARSAARRHRPVPVLLTYPSI
jgi:hypothetical protein